MKSFKNLVLLCLFLSVFLSPFYAYALQVKRIEPPQGILVLDDSREVRLAGIDLDPEAFKSLAILFSGKDIEISEEKVISDSTGRPSVYLSVKTFEISFPFETPSSPTISRILVNEMLVHSGLASVNEAVEFKEREAYLKLQAEAQALGRGMWSQEPSLKKK